MTELAPVLESISSLLYIVLGIWVLTLTPSRRQTRLLGLFAVLFGLVWAPVNLLQILGVVERFGVLWNLIQLLFGGPAFVVAFGLACTVPEPLDDRRLLGIALGAGMVFGLAGLAAFLGFSTLTGVDRWATAGKHLVLGIVYGAVFLTALRADPSRGAGPGEATQLALVSVALAMFFAFTAGAGVPSLGQAVASNQWAGAALTGVGVLVWLVAAGLWGRNMVRASGAAVRVHRTVMLAILAVLTGGTLYFAAVPGASTLDTVMRSVVQTLGVGLLAYGILRHDLAGLDEKVEYGVSRTTVAGVFVAVFFVVSEGAQVLFAGFAGSEILGVLAAGGLVFFLAPIQRAADELAEAVVPGGEGPVAGSAAQAEATYRRTLERYLADGELTAEEGHELGQLASQLGLDPDRARELREQVGDEADGDPQAPGGDD